MMENKKKAISRGYTFEVESWENDGDHCQTKFLTVESESEARLISRICKELFPKLGNTMDGEGYRILKKFISDNTEMFESIDKPESYVSELSYKLMGGSEWYDYRVLESFTIAYSEHDVFLTEVKF